MSKVLKRGPVQDLFLCFSPGFAQKRCNFDPDGTLDALAEQIASEWNRSG